MSDYVPKVVRLPGVTLTPQLVLNRTTEKLDRIKAIFIVIQWDDTTHACDWSSMKLSELCMMKDVAHVEVFDEIRRHANTE